MRSNEPINVSNCAQSESESSSKPRKRKGFLGLGNRSEGEEIESPAADAPVDKQKFTAVGQFKATVLNSWINVLLLAAPVGSRLPSTQHSTFANSFQLR
jgi:Ca2+:H+ antiporter